MLVLSFVYSWMLGIPSVGPTLCILVDVGVPTVGPTLCVLVDVGDAKCWSYPVRTRGCWG